MYSDNDFRLYHHGIKGQKWGTMHGPPYPLDKSISTGKRLKVSSEPHSYKDGVDPVTLAILTWDLAVVALPVVSIGKEVVSNQIVKRNVKKFDAERKAAKEDPETGLKLKSKEMTREEDMKRVNPKYKIDPLGSRQNCTNCTMTYEMRRRGFDVTAKPMLDGRNGFEFAKHLFPESKNKGIMPLPLPKGWDDPKIEDKETLDWSKYDAFVATYEPLARRGANSELASKTISALKSEPPGSRGQLLISWDRWSGHSVAYEITSNGKVNILDAQSNTIYDERKAKKLLKHSIATSYQRLDNTGFDKDAVKEAMK